MNKQIFYDTLVDLDEIVSAEFMPADPNDEDTRDEILVYFRENENQASYYDETARALWAELKSKFGRK